MWSFLLWAHNTFCFFTCVALVVFPSFLQSCLYLGLHDFLLCYQFSHIICSASVSYTPSLCHWHILNVNTLCIQVQHCDTALVLDSKSAKCTILIEFLEWNLQFIIFLFICGHHLNLWLVAVISVMIKPDVLMSWLQFKELELTSEWSVGSVRHII